MELRGYDLRHLITSLVLDHGATSTSLLRRRLVGLGVDLGPDPRRRLYGAIRSEITKGRLVRSRRSVYGIGEIPRGTRDRLRRRARELEAALADGLADPPLPRYHPLSGVLDPLSASRIRDAGNIHPSALALVSRTGDANARSEDSTRGT